MQLSLALQLEQAVPFAAGQAFGPSGAYQIISGQARFSYRPGDADTAGLGYDLSLAETDPDGVAHGWADVSILRPVDLDLCSGTLLFEFLNRGNKRSLQFLNDAVASNAPLSAAEAGNGWLMRQGHVLVTAAWQADVLRGNGRQVLQVPTARQDGKPITSTLSAEFIADAPGIRCFPLSGKSSTHSYAAHAPEQPNATLVRRRYPWSEAENIPRQAWEFARIDGGATGPGSGDVLADTAILPSDSHIHLATGFETGWIYELRYIARDPLVLDLGLALVRDLVVQLRTDSGATNPLAQDGRARITSALAWGRSQAGRAIREFVYRGFNADAHGQTVFDGVLPHVAGAGRINTNRFSNLNVPASRQYEDHDHPADRFPFAYAATTDPVTGRSDAILTRPLSDPLVIHTQTSTEYWNRRGSLVHTDAAGNDLDAPRGVRIYAWLGSQHWADPAVHHASHGICQNLFNVVSTSALLRCAVQLLERWVRTGEEPPPSRHPTRADRTLVAFAEWESAFPAIPGVALPCGPNALEALDHGRVFDDGLPLPVDALRAGAPPCAVLVPAPDCDGNDLGGVRAPMAGVPVATYTGWNLRRRGFGEGALHDFSGSSLPLPVATSHQLAARDPRTALADRYGDLAGYAQRVRAYSVELQGRGFLLAEDIDDVTGTAVRWARTFGL